MKTIKLFLAFCFLTFNFHLLTFNCFAQAPQAFNYQAIIRNSSGIELPNHHVGIKINLLQGNATGIAIYSEEHSPTTNQFGLVNLKIGNGTNPIGNFANINWGSNSFFIKVELDTSGNNNYATMGTSQLLSVPYALYADKSSSNSDTINGTNNYISKFTGATSLGNSLLYQNGKYVGLGTTTPVGRFIIQADPTTPDTIPLFEVKDKTGQTVFVIWPNGAQLYLTHDTSSSKASQNKGSFAVSGRTTSKSATINDYLFVTPDTTRIYTSDTTHGFGVRNIGATEKTSYMQLTPSNYFIGHEAGKYITTGLYNSFMGYQAGKSNTLGGYNVFLGYQSGFSNIGGLFNTANGYQALYSNTEGNYNNAIGDMTLYFNTTGTGNTANGDMALYLNTTGSWNTAIGASTLYNNTVGNQNVGIGSNSLGSNTTGSYNTATGSGALMSNTIGSYNTANGITALTSNITGNKNTAIGEDALSWNTIGSNNTALGYNAFYFGDTCSNSTALGASSIITASNQVRIGDVNVTSIGGYAGWTTLPSDKRFKKDINETVPGLAFINKLRPVTYYIDMDVISNFLKTPDSLRLKDSERFKANQLQTGFIAQEVEKAANDLGFDFSGVDKPKNENDFYGLRYAEFTVPLVKAVQEQQQMIEKLKAENLQLKSDNQQLKSDNEQIKKDNHKIQTEIADIKIFIGMVKK